MAIKLEKELASGVVADYWRIDEINYRESLVVVCLYFDKSKTYVTKIRLSLEIDKINDSLGDLYNKIKLLPEFLEATNC